MLEETSLLEAAGAESWRDLEREFGPRLFTDVIFHLTRLEFPPAQARELWDDVLAHRLDLGRALGRGVSLRTAVCDYFHTLRGLLENPVVVDSRILRHYEECALADELTGLGNRRFFNHELPREIDRAKRSGSPVSLLMVDVDHFKDFNDRFGHQAGDKALQDLADLLRTHARTVDHVTRYGGEEFAVILPHAGKEEALQVAERHRRAVEEFSFHVNPTTKARITISGGTSTFPTEARTGAELVARSDMALYRAKSRGRNVICQDVRDMRAHPRIPVRLQADLVLGEKPIHGRTVNLSLGGMLYESKEPVEVGRDMEAVLKHPPSGSQLPVTARAVRMVDAPRPGVFYSGVLFDPGRTDKAAVADLLRNAGAWN